MKPTDRKEVEKALEKKGFQFLLRLDLQSGPGRTSGYCCVRPG